MNVVKTTIEKKLDLSGFFQNQRFATVAFSSDFATPVSLFHKLSQDCQNAFLFESTEGDGKLARFSFLGVDPLLTVSLSQGKAIVRDGAGLEIASHATADPVDFLASVLDQYRQNVAGKTPDFPFSGGLVGYMGYGVTQYLEGIEAQAKDPHEIPVLHYGLYDSAVVFDHQFRRVTFFSHRGEEHLRMLVKRSMEAATPATLPPLRLGASALSDDKIFADITTSVSKEEFCRSVEKAKDYICQGQVFQIVLSQRLSLPVTASAIDVYRMITATNPSPYAYYLKCPGFVYLGSSPETFVRVADGQALLRALAGTRKRGKTQEDDLRLAFELKSSEKEMAEHMMLVDLGRNDLGRVCAPGSIEVGELARLNLYTHVMHLATEITGSLAKGKTCFDAFKSCFPAGTVSGAPKVRAMQLLRELEPERRGVYSGAVGYFDVSGNMDGAIAIRSALIKDGMAHVNVGAGIVFDSEPEHEYLETRNKAKSILQAIKLANEVK